MRRVLLLVLLVLVAAGGGFWAYRSGLFQRKASAPPPPPPPVVEVAPTAATTLFPTVDQQAVFDFNDGTHSTELLLPDGERLIQTYNGQTYVTWFLTTDGLYRADPKAAAQPLLLRYLPAQLKDGLVWKQPVQNGVVWFKLVRQQECKPAGQSAAECWQLLVLNRKELTTFTFATGMGAVAAVAENGANAKESFTKTLKSFAPATVGATQRKALLDKGLKAERFTRAPVETATPADFDKARTDEMGKQGAASTAAPVAGPPVDWMPGLMGTPPTNLPHTKQACAIGNAPLQVQITAAEWRAHPKNQAFWAPSLTLGICNTSGLTLKGEQLSIPLLDPDGKDQGDMGVQLPELQPGEGIGPVRIYASRGVPARIGQSWQLEGRLWPTLTALVAFDGAQLAELPIRRMLAGSRPSTVEASGGGLTLPDPPSLDLLRLFARSEAKIPLPSGKQATVFLYAPDAQYWVESGSYCGAASGQVSARAKHWGLYVSVDDGAPVKAADVGSRDFPGDRGLSSQGVPALRTTFLGIEGYGSCNNPQSQVYWAFEYDTGTVYRPEMRAESGDMVGASDDFGTVGTDGALSSRFFNNGDGKNHTLHYAWDQRERMWVFQSHTIK